MAERALGDCESALAAYHRSVVWNVAAGVLHGEIGERLTQARQLLHALAELEAILSSPTAHAPGCVFQPVRPA